MGRPEMLAFPRTQEQHPHAGLPKLSPNPGTFVNIQTLRIAEMAVQREIERFQGIQIIAYGLCEGSPPAALVRNAAAHQSALCDARTDLIRAIESQTQHIQD
jgi:hypothetical protein